MDPLRDELDYVAKLAELTKRRNEMLESMEKVANNAAYSGKKLTHKERNLLFSACKNVMGDCYLRSYTRLCCAMLKLLDSRFIPSAASVESKVERMQIKAALHMYLVTFKTGSERKEAVETTLEAYKSAQDIANAELAPTHPNRLALANDFSIFYYRILKSPDRACNLIKQALDEANAELDKLGQDNSLTYEGSNTDTVMQYLRQNLTLWTYEMQVGRGLRHKNLLAGAAPNPDSIRRGKRFASNVAKFFLVSTLWSFVFGKIIRIYGLECI